MYISLLVCCCWPWWTTLLLNTLTWCYCMVKLGAMGDLLVNYMQSIFHTVRHLRTPSLLRCISSLGDGYIHHQKSQLWCTTAALHTQVWRDCTPCSGRGHDDEYQKRNRYTECGSPNCLTCSAWAAVTPIPPPEGTGNAATGFYITSPLLQLVINFTDEAKFTREAVLNSRNSHVWADENLHDARTHEFQEWYSLNIWAGFLDGCVIGPYLLQPNLMGATYLWFFEGVLHGLLKGVPLHVHQNTWFQHNGTPLHFSLAVRDHLDQWFGQQWIGRGDPIAWPAHSPD